MSNGQKQPENDWMARLFKDAMNLKQVMLKKNLTRAKAKCPEPGCNGHLHAVLAGPKKHLHMQCDGECTRRVME